MGVVRNGVRQGARSRSSGASVRPDVGEVPWFRAYKSSWVDDSTSDPVVHEPAELEPGSHAELRNDTIDPGDESQFTVVIDDPGIWHVHCSVDVTSSTGELGTVSMGANYKPDTFIEYTPFGESLPFPFIGNSSDHWFDLAGEGFDDILRVSASGMVPLSEIVQGAIGPGLAVNALFEDYYQWPIAGWPGGSWVMNIKVAGLLVYPGPVRTVFGEH